jgi:hypothetical protein
MEVKWMSDTELLIEEVQALPKGYVHEVLNFISHLKQKNSPAGFPGKNSLPELPPAYSPEEALRKSAERAAARRANPVLNTFKMYHGCLKDSPNFNRDGMAIQRELRSEWE